ncbi:MAG: entericidin A/B family lipoprotein [Rubrivivax sp.]|nr:MAG: entericidin A/B family lipoprotein [Rubrivivax sp.]
MKRFTLIATLIAGLSLVGCNTVHGFGQDVEKVGDKISGAAKK